MNCWHLKKEVSISNWFAQYIDILTTVLFHQDVNMLTQSMLLRLPGEGYVRLSNEKHCHRPPLLFTSLAFITRQNFYHWINSLSEPTNRQPAKETARLGLWKIQTRLDIGQRRAGYNLDFYSRIGGGQCYLLDIGQGKLANRHTKLQASPPLQKTRQKLKVFDLTVLDISLISHKRTHPFKLR